ncbi:uncharacterized protein LOC113235437 [Hyposmocoma kahamanoa]|uniref:uncharacterized protein LOC113235437 n=1 Tax=Hyposmocoma kahamanoa TaxID=1477025 RepID=UPI000E6D8868|nr:uncharacterized protein LOC113235437 [Hyposmocoma kahamanoa]
MSDRNQHAAERDTVKNQLGTNKDGDSRISQQLLKYRCGGSSKATSSDTDINSKSRGDVIDSDATEILERLQYSKSSNDEESSTKVDDKEKNSELSYNLGDSCVIPVNLQSLTGYITKSRSVENLTAPKSPLKLTRIPDISHLLNESTSDERERPIASSTPIEEYDFLETIAEVHMVLDQDALKCPDHEDDILHSNTERREAEKNHTSREDTSDVEEDNNIRHENRGHPDPEIEVMRSVHTSSQRLSIECQTLSSNTESSVPDFSTALYLSFESIRNSNNGMNARETSIINDYFPRISAMERISINENEKLRVGLKRVFSFPENSTKRLKSVNTQTNEIAKQRKHAFVPTIHMALLVNIVTQTEEMPKTNIDIQTQVDTQVKTVQIQTEQAATNNIEI